MKKFVGFNLIVFMFLLSLFIIGAMMQNYIDYGFGGNNWTNPMTEAYYFFTGIILQVFSAIGVLIQLVFVSKKLSDLK